MGHRAAADVVGTPVAVGEGSSVGLQLSGLVEVGVLMEQLTVGIVGEVERHSVALRVHGGVVAALVASILVAPVVVPEAVVVLGCSSPHLNVLQPNRY